MDMDGVHSHPQQRCAGRFRVRREKIRVWDVATGKPQWTLEGHQDRVTVLAITPDGKRVVSGSRDGTLKVWDLESGEVIANFSGDSELRSCTFASDRVTVVAGEASGRVHFLRLEGVA